MLLSKATTQGSLGKEPCTRICKTQSNFVESSLKQAHIQEKKKKWTANSSDLYGLGQGAQLYFFCPSAFMAFLEWVTGHQVNITAAV